jgi:uncharacterized protein (DUF2132 family)
VAEKYVEGEPWVKSPDRLKKLGPYSRELHEYYLKEVKKPPRQRTTSITVEFTKDHFHHDFEFCQIYVYFVDLWELYNLRSLEASIIRCYTL